MYIFNGSYHTLRLLVCLLLFLLFEIIYQGNMMIPIFFNKIYTFLHFLFVYVVCRPSQQWFTHMETVLLPMRGCRVTPMVGSYGL